MELSYQVDRDHAGCCVRQAARGPMHLSEKLWRKIKWNGTITVNGSPVSSPSHRLEAGDRLVFHWEEKAAVIPVHLPLSVLYEDEDLLVVDKPAGMLIHPTWSGARDTLVQAVGGYFRRTGQHCGIHPLYRLDRDTTGVLMVAKSAFAKHALTRDHSQIYREYLAVCEGRWGIPQGRIEHPIGRVAEGVDRAARWPAGGDGIPDPEREPGMDGAENPSAHRPDPPDPGPFCPRRTPAGGGSPVRDKRRPDRPSGSPRLDRPFPASPDRRRDAPHRTDAGGYGGAAGGEKQCRVKRAGRQTTNDEPAGLPERTL